MRLLLVLGLALSLSACAIKPIHHTATCNFTRFVIDVPMPAADGGAAFMVGAARVSKQSEDVLLDALKGASPAPARTHALTRAGLDARAPAAMTADRLYTGPSMLFLSGGSQHGAFGAGFLKGWKERETNLPHFSVVTGISTGAILATFAFVNAPEAMAKAYSIQRESELLEPLVSMRNGEPTLKGYLDLLKKGAIADLGPLRGTLGNALTDDILIAVSQGAREGRILRVGVVNVDTGEAVSLDLGEMAVRWAAAAEKSRSSDAESRREGLQDMATAKACYVEAIIASSSAPLAARPVFIDERMYIDGGVRFGAFSNELEKVAELASRPENQILGRPLTPTIYLLVNGDQHLPSRCGRRSEADCDPPRDAANKSKPLGDPAESQPVGPHKNWEFQKMALRSEQILANQIYRFSADSIAYIAHRRGMPLHYAQISADKGKHIFQLEDAVLGSGKMTCDQAFEADRTLASPVQFYPRYMHCLVDYGYRRGLSGWTPTGL
jgi:predicted acylesterase/phospholipase RssA